MTTTTISITLPIRPHAKQRAIIDSPARYNVIAAGRRFGKTEAAKIRAIYRAMQGRVWWVNKTWSNGSDTWRQFERFFRQLPGLHPQRDINRSERRIQTPWGGELQMVTETAFKRGPGVNHIVLDEAAFMDPDLWQYELQPMLLESRGSADFVSSPNGRNYFYVLFQRGLDPEYPDWRSWHFTSYDNPRIPRAEFDTIRQQIPARPFAQEYLAEFLEDGGAVFRNLQACIMDTLPEPQGPVVVGVDWGRVDDYTVLVAVDTATGTVVGVDRFHQIGWQMQRDRLQSFIEQWDTAYVLAEQNSIGGPNIEALQDEGLPVEGFNTTNASKATVIEGLALAFEQAEIGIPDNPVLLGELQAYGIERLPSGTWRYGAPSGMHDDTVIALALAWHAHINRPVFRAMQF